MCVTSKRYQKHVHANNPPSSSQGEVRDIAVARRQSGQWLQGRHPAEDHWRITGCPVNGPALDAVGESVVLSWYTQAPSPRVRVAFSNDSGRSFLPSLDVAVRRPIGRVDVVLVERGHAVVSWLEGGAGNGEGNLMIQRIKADGNAGTPEVVTMMSTRRDAGFPRLPIYGLQFLALFREALEDQRPGMTYGVSIQYLERPAHR